MNEETSNYWQQSRRPLTSLVFVLPLLVIYEGGVLVLGPDAIHNGVEQWLRSGLSWLGFGQYFLLPLLTIALLLAWHHTTGEPWHVQASVVYRMFIESGVWAVALIVLYNIYRAVTTSIENLLAQVPAAESGITSTIAKFTGFCGAGLYEELLFRLMLLPVVMWVVLPIVKRRAWAAAIAVISTSLVFSAAHYIGPEAFKWTTLGYRTLAGAFFAGLFVSRGFGIAAGSHAMYDLFVAQW